MLKLITRPRWNVIDFIIFFAFWNYVFRGEVAAGFVLLVLGTIVSVALHRKAYPRVTPWRRNS